MDRKRTHQSLAESFRHAFEGIGSTVAQERNIKLHLTAAALVVIFGVWLGLSVTEWMVCLLFIALVISLELVNTAVEAAVDLTTSERHPLAKKAKDAAAGAVLFASLCAFVAGCVIFLPKLAGVFL